MMNTLIVAPAWIGDAIMAEPLYRTLASKMQLDVLAPAWSAAVHARMPSVNAIWNNPFAHGEINWRGRWHLARQLARQHYDLAIVLPNSLKSALVPFLAGIPKRRGWRGEMRYGLLNDLRILNKQKLPLMVERFLALASDDQTCQTLDLSREQLFPKLEISSQAREKALQKHQLNANTPIIALCAGAEFGEAKRWPADKFANLATQCLSLGAQIWLFGSQKDFAIADQIAQQTQSQFSGGQNRIHNLCGKTDLGEALDLLSLARVAVTNDSGLMHMAAALGVAVVAIYGSSSPSFTPPLSSRAQIVSLNLDCSPCFQRQCPKSHMNCLNQLDSERVFKHVQYFFDQNQ